MNPENSEQQSNDSPYRWDFYSDQPYPVSDKSAKRAIRRRGFFAQFKAVAISVVALPSILYRYLVLNRFNLQQKLDDKFGICINLDKDPDLTSRLIKELGIKKLSIRVPLSDLDNLFQYKEFAKRFMDKDILFVVLQDRPNIENKTLRAESFSQVFSELSFISNSFQIGNAINRSKWGFVSIDEYLDFFSTAQEIRDEKFPHLELFGCAVIDFEIHNIIRSLWHRYPITYDGVSALLYVDRRGAPENKQFIFDLIGKINFLSATLLSSNKSFKRMLITEVNWPIKDTKPYAPALGDVWVDENDYANYMLRYYLLALANANVECVYWHQLIAPGYGLVDNRSKEVRVRRAFYMLAFLIRSCSGARIIEVDQGDGYYILKFKNFSNKCFEILWSTSEVFSMTVPPNMSAVNALGEPLAGSGDMLTIGPEPVYFFEQTASIK